MAHRKQGEGGHPPPPSASATQTSGRPTRAPKPIDRLGDQGSAPAKPAAKPTAGTAGASKATADKNGDDAGEEEENQDDDNAPPAKKGAAASKPKGRATTKPKAKTSAGSKGGKGRKRGGADEGENEPPAKKTRAPRKKVKKDPDERLPYDVDFRARESLIQLRSIRTQIRQDVFMGDEVVKGWLDPALQLLNNAITEFERVLPKDGPMGGGPPDGDSPPSTPGGDPKSPKGRGGKKDDGPEKLKGPGGGDDDGGEDDDGKPPPDGAKKRAAGVATGGTKAGRGERRPAEEGEDSDDEAVVPDPFTMPKSPERKAYVGKGKGPMSKADEINGLRSPSPKTKKVTFGNGKIDAGGSKRKRGASVNDDDNKDELGLIVEPPRKKQKSPQGKSSAADGRSNQAEDLMNKSPKQKSPTSTAGQESISGRTRATHSPQFEEPPLQDDGLAPPKKGQTKMTKPKESSKTKQRLRSTSTKTTAPAEGKGKA